MKIQTITLTDGRRVTVGELPQEAIASTGDSVSLAVAAYQMLVDRTASACSEGSLTNCAWYWDLLSWGSRPYQDMRIAWIEDGNLNPIVGVLVTESTDRTKECPDEVSQRNANSYELQFGEGEKAIRMAMFGVEASWCQRMPTAQAERLENATRVHLAAIAPEYDQTSLFRDLVGLLPSQADYAVHLPVSEQQKWEACGFNALAMNPQGAHTGEETGGATTYPYNGIPDQVIMVRFSVDPTEKLNGRIP